MANFTTLREAVSSNLADGDTVAFEGFTHLIPHAAAHEAIRQGRKDLTLIRMTPDIIYDQMIGMGMAKKLIFSYAGNPGVGLLRRLRDAVENGWPNALETEEHSHSAMANAYEAGAAGLPCAIFRGYRGAELKRVNPNIKAVTCPFTGEELAAVPAVRPDVSFIHAQKADRKGNVLIEGIVGIRRKLSLRRNGPWSPSRKSSTNSTRIPTPACCRHGRLPPSARCRAGRIRPMRMAITRATTRDTWSGTRSRPTETGSSHG